METSSSTMSSEEEEDRRRHRQTFEDLVSMLGARVPPRDILEYLEASKVSEDDLKEVLQLRDEERYWAQGFNLVHHAVIRGDSDIAAMLLRVGPEAAFAATTELGNLPIHVACSKGHSPGVVRALLNTDESGRSLLEKNRDGNLPLHYLCGLRLYEGLQETVQLLLDRDPLRSSLLARNAGGMTAMDRAARSNIPDIFALLAEQRIGIVAGPSCWRASLRDMLSSHRSALAQQSIEMLQRMKRYEFAVDFQERADAYDELADGIPLLEMAIWKGKGLPTNPEDRKERRVTCGSATIINLVAAYI